MKILHTVEFYYPSKGGSQEVVRQLSERLVKLGHDVTVATTKLQERAENIINGVTIKEFSISGNYVRGYEGELQAYTDFILHSDFDLIMNYAAQQWATDLCLPVLKKIKAKKVLVPCGYSGLFLNAYRDYFDKMKGWLKLYDASVYLSSNYRDINFAKENGIVNCRVIPNGCGMDEFYIAPNINIYKELKISEESFIILHVGSHTGLKGHKELMRIFKKADISNTTLLIIGNVIDSKCMKSCEHTAWLYNRSFRACLKGNRIIVGDLSRETTVAAYHAADLFLFPSNIECSPLVLFEAAASRTPFLTTDVGNSQEIIVWTKAGKVLPTFIDRDGYSHADIKGSAALLRDIWSSPTTLKTMAENGYNAWMDRFTWEKITKEYENLYLELLGRSA